jgi:hypothetical protein
MKIRQVRTEFFFAEREFDRHEETNSRFSLFCEGGY